MHQIKKIFWASKKALKLRYKSIKKKFLGTGKIVMPPVTSVNLQKFFRQAGIKILDVGTRGGVLSQFNVLSRFSEIFICEPDVKEAKRVEEKLLTRGNFLKVTSIREALYSREGTEPFFVTKNGAASSFLAPDDDFISNFYDGEPNRLPEIFTVLKKIDIPVISLKQAVEKYKMENLSVIKLDTQGTELDILKSGTDALKSVVCVYIEMEFLPFYKNQPLFSEINNFLESQGFRIAALNNSFTKRLTKAKPAASAHELLGTHAIYFRGKNPDGTLPDIDQKIRLVCMAFAFCYFEYAIWLLEQDDMRMYLRSQNLDGLQNEIADYSDLARKRIKGLVSVAS